LNTLNPLTLFKKLTEAGGIQVSRIRKAETRNGYELVSPMATYAPWLGDRLFNDVYTSVKRHTLVDKYRCYELWQLVAEAKQLRGALIEIGVWKGGSGALIAAKAKLEGIRDEVYLCDTFTGVVKASSMDSCYKGQEHADTSLEIVQSLVESLKLDNVRILPGVFPEQTAAPLCQTSFRFCHIDVDVYQSAKDIVEWLWPKLVLGGIIVFDDYGFVTCDGVTRLVNERMGIEGSITLHNLNGHAICVRTSSQQ
jgi:O-methyltransferase